VKRVHVIHHAHWRRERMVRALLHAALAARMALVRQVDAWLDCRRGGCASFRRLDGLVTAQGW